MIQHLDEFLGRKSADLGKGRLTERLLAQGILTPNMLQALKKEWDKQGDENNDNSSNKKTKWKRKTK